MKYILAIVLSIAYTILLVSVILYLNKETNDKTVLLSDTVEYDSIEITVTTYNAIKSQCDNNPNITASGDKINEKTIMMDRFCAISRDLKDSLAIQFGDTIEITDPPYNGKYIVKDIMNKRIKNTIDVLIPKGQQHVKYKSQIIKL